MRTHGTLARWSDDRGFGFIAPTQPGSEVFVHVSAFPRDGVRPRIGELVSFEVEPGPNGKPRAVRVQRPGRRQPRRRADAGRPYGALRTAVAVVAIAALAAYGYKRFATHDAEAVVPAPPLATKTTAPAPARDTLPPASSEAAASSASNTTSSPASSVVVPTAPSVASAPVNAATSFRCDGRTMCSQMTSCAEARYFLQHCPATKMDGDGDGEPCESQWCGNGR